MNIGNRIDILKSKTINYNINSSSSDTEFDTINTTVITPISDNQYNLESSSHRFKNLYVHDIHV